MLGRMVLVLEREGVSLRADSGSQQEQDERNPAAPARLSYHGNYYTVELIGPAGGPLPGSGCDVR